jgi:hypothetical protein
MYTPCKTETNLEKQWNNPNFTATCSKLKKTLNGISIWIVTKAEEYD